MVACGCTGMRLYAYRYGCWGDFQNIAQPDSTESAYLPRQFLGAGIDQYIYNNEFAIQHGNTAESNGWQAQAPTPPVGTTYVGVPCMGGVAEDNIAGTDFHPRYILDQMMACSGVTHGLIVTVCVHSHHHLCDVLDSGDIHCTSKKRAHNINTGW